MKQKQKEKLLDSFVNLQSKMQHGFVIDANDDDLLFAHQYPINLYKYRKCDIYNFNALRTRKVWFALPSSWPDPDDTTVEFDFLNENYYLENHFEEFFNEFASLLINRDSLIKRKHLSYSKSELQEATKQLLTKDGKIRHNILNDEFINKYGLVKTCILQKKLNEILKYIEKNNICKLIADNLSEIVYKTSEIKCEYMASCFSENNNNKHQWEEYASNYSGFCIKYTNYNKHDINLINYLFPIIYGERVPVKMKDLIRASQTKEQFYVDKVCKNIFKSLFVKRTIFNGEQEWRIFGAKYNGKSGELLDFDFADCIYLGYKIKEKDKNELINIAKELNIPVYQQFIHDNGKLGYKLVK